MQKREELEALLRDGDEPENGNHRITGGAGAHRALSDSGFLPAATQRSLHDYTVRKSSVRLPSNASSCSTGGNSGRAEGRDNKRWDRLHRLVELPPELRSKVSGDARNPLAVSDPSGAQTVKVRSE